MALHILMADDDPLILQLYGHHLEAAGYRFSTALTGEQALELAYADPPHLIILDVMMPGLGGLATLRELKGQPATAAIPVIVITSMQAYHVCSKEARMMGASAFLTKPFSPAQLLAEVSKVLGDTTQAQSGSG
jgi:DNA-binding response OmpR family regulator